MDTSNLSLMERVALLPPRERDEFFAGMSDEELKALEYYWPAWARPKQLPPKGDWLYWLLLAGRGFGKSRTGAEYVRYRMSTIADCERATLIAPTSADVRDIMIEGPAGIMRVHPDHERPEYNPSKRRLTWPNGAIATCYSAEDPEAIRGGEVSLVWCEELAAWTFVDEAWDQLQFTLRALGDLKIVITTTPKPIDLVKKLASDPRTHLTTGSSYENIGNLNPVFFEQVIKPYEGTRLGRQEIYAEILNQIEGALWTETLLDRTRVLRHPALYRKVVAVDPPASSTDTSDEAGIVVMGVGEAPISMRGGPVPEDVRDLPHGYVLKDLSFGKARPEAWAAAAVNAYHQEECDAIIAEVNNGGDMVENTIKGVDANVPVIKVRASRGKEVRAEPISTMTENSRIHIVGSLPKLEQQLTTWVPGVSKKSPDRLDAFVWAATELMLKDGKKKKARVRNKRGARA